MSGAAPISFNHIAVYSIAVDDIALCSYPASTSSTLPYMYRYILEMWLCLWRSSADTTAQQHSQYGQWPTDTSTAPPACLQGVYRWTGTYGRDSMVHTTFQDE